MKPITWTGCDTLWRAELEGVQARYGRSSDGHWSAYVRTAKKKSDDFHTKEYEGYFTTGALARTCCEWIMRAVVAERKAQP